MEILGYGALGTLLVVLWLGLTIAVCLRFNAWLIPVALGLDFLVGLTGSPVALLMWKLCFFYGMARWDPLRGLFRMPRWPRMWLPGSGGRRKREFREPMPWTRGPGSY